MVVQSAFEGETEETFSPLDMTPTSSKYLPTVLNNEDLGSQVFDVVEQARLMEAAVATKPDGIAVSIADADAMRKSVQGALAANSPVVVVDSGELTGEEMGTTLYVGTVSEYDSGKKAGERLAKDGIR